jgi:thiamine biosynthesis lipoprotein
MMNKRLSIQLLLVVCFFLIAWLIGMISKRSEYVSFFGFTQGTSYRISYESKKGVHFQVMIDSLLAEIDQSLSLYNPTSIISRFNNNEPGTLADEMFTEVFAKSIEVNRLTNGAFDITVGPIVNALGFGSGDTLKVDSAMIDSLRFFVGMEKVKLEKDRLIKSGEQVRIDMNALAQGYSVDLVAEFLEQHKIRHYMVEIGGEIRAKGKNDRNQTWKIGIDKPLEGNDIPGENLQAIIRLNNSSLATSGNYRKYYVRDGIKYVHTIDPETGYPVMSNLLSATVVADDCMTADAYATALMVFGVERSIDFLKENDFLDAYLIYADEQGNFQVYITPGLKKYITN